MTDAVPTPASESVSAAKRPHRLPWIVAVVALGISATGPLWQDRVMKAVGIDTPLSRAQQEDALVLGRQERKLWDLEQRLAATTVRLTEVQAELARIAGRQVDAVAWARAMAMTRLGDALRQSAPFGADLAVARVAGVDLEDAMPLIEQVAPYAAMGVPSPADIDREFRRIAGEIPRPGSGMGATLWLGNLTGWARPAPAASPSDTTAILVRNAGASVADGNYAAAVEQLRQIGGSHEQAFAGWIEDAQARVAADLIVRRVDETMARALRPAVR